MKKRILLFSGGLDSLLLKQMENFKNNECLYINLHTVENKQEMQFIKMNFPGCIIIDLSLQRFELNNKIIPFRNHILSMIAANFGNSLYFAFTKGDTTKDKDYVFKSQIENILNYFSIDTNKVTIPGPFEICMPFKELTKTEVINLFLRKGGDYRLLQKATSCYSGIEGGCGTCRSCLRKYVACYNNDIKLNFQPSIQELEILLKEAIKKGRNKEIKEIKACIKQRQQ